MTVRACSHGVRLIMRKERAAPSIRTLPAIPAPPAAPAPPAVPAPRYIITAED
jgi:hypothetical protein